MVFELSYWKDLTRYPYEWPFVTTVSMYEKVLEGKSGVI